MVVVEAPKSLLFEDRTSWNADSSGIDSWEHDSALVRCLCDYGRLLHDLLRPHSSLMGGQACNRPGFIWPPRLGEEQASIVKGPISQEET